MRFAIPRGRGVRRPDQRECQDTGNGSDGGGHEACLGKAAGECLITDLSPRFWIKANNFQGLFAFLLYCVATIKFIYIALLP